MKKDKCERKEWPIKVVLTALTGIPLVDRHEVHEFLKWVTQEDAWGCGQVGQLIRAVRPHLSKQLPSMPAFDNGRGSTTNKVTPETEAAWLKEQITKHGKKIEVEQLPKDTKYKQDTVDALFGMMGG